DGPIAVQELPATLGVAETFGEWKGRCEPRDCFRHIGVVEHGYYGITWCRAVLLQHRIGGYQRFPGRLTRPRSAAATESANENFWKYLCHRRRNCKSSSGPLHRLG